MRLRQTAGRADARSRGAWPIRARTSGPSAVPLGLSQRADHLGLHRRRELAWRATGVAAV